MKKDCQSLILTPNAETQFSTAWSQIFHVYINETFSDSTVESSRLKKLRSYLHSLFTEYLLCISSCSGSWNTNMNTILPSRYILQEIQWKWLAKHKVDKQMMQ